MLNFKENWVDRIDGYDKVKANDINAVAQAVIETQDEFLKNPPVGIPGKDGENGATFTPSMSADGTLSWGNDKGLPNPKPTNLTGPKGNTGVGGKSAYQYAKEAGYTGTEEDFARNISHEIPTKTSQLTNDSKYLAEDDLVTQIQVPGDPYKPLSASAGAQLKTLIGYTNEDVDELTSKVDHLQKYVNSIADSDDETLDQLSEIVTYIKSNKSLIDSITTSKVSVADIVDNMTSTDKDKPLSANQGRLLRQLIDLTREQKLDATALAEAIETALAEAKASGEFKGDKGDDGVTPHIGENGNWYLGDNDTGVKAEGQDGKDGENGKSAFEYAIDGGFAGDENVFATKLAKLGESEWQAVKTYGSGVTTIFPSQSVLFAGRTSTVSGFKLIEGVTYSVNWAGTVYESVAEKNADGEIFIGDYNLLSSTTVREYPFAIVYFGGDGGVIWKATSTTEPIRISIDSMMSVSYEKLPKEYLPDSFEVILTSSGNKKFRLLVDDNGSLSTEQVVS